MGNVWLLSLVSFFTDMGSYMVVPLIPLVLASSGPLVIGIIDGVSESLSSLLKLASGSISDRSKNHKWIAISGYGLSGIGRIFLIVASSWVGVFIWKLVDRIGKGIRTAPRDALISEAGGKRRQGRAFGLHQTMDMLGATMGVGIAYLLLAAHTHNDYSLVFWASLIPISVGLVILLKVKENHKGKGTKSITPEGEQKPKEKIKRSFGGWDRLNRPTKLLLLVVLLFTFANSSNSFLLLRANELGVSAENTLLLYLLFYLVASSLSYLSGSIADRIGSRIILTTGYTVYGLIYIGFGAASSVWQLWAAFALLGVHSAATKGVEKAVVANFSPSDLKATALGAYAMVSGIGLLPASLLMGVIWESYGSEIAFFVSGAIALMTALLMYMFLSKHEHLI